MLNIALLQKNLGTLKRSLVIFNGTIEGWEFVKLHILQAQWYEGVTH